jgi:quercetin dioxygenase-like cupin family protein
MGPVAAVKFDRKAETMLTEAGWSSARKLEFDPERFRWVGLGGRAYKGTDERRGMHWAGVSRFVLGPPPEAPAAFELRYFELEPGGYSSLEKHRHIHFVVVLRGQGKALVGRRVFQVKPFDVVYVPPGTPHRWLNDGPEPFGFLCPVDAERDRPEPLSDAEWEALRADPTTAPYVF